jgi:hypothetical protein
VSYCGLTSALVSSADKQQRGPISKQRNSHLQTVLIEAAKLAPRWNLDISTGRRRAVIESVKPRTPEYVEGPEAFTRFQNAMKAVIASVTLSTDCSEHLCFQQTEFASRGSQWFFASRLGRVEMLIAESFLRVFRVGSWSSLEG